MQKRLPVVPSSRPDPRVIDCVARAQKYCLAAAAAIAATILAAWMVPAIGALLPHSWTLMKANTALGILMGVATLSLSLPERSRREVQMSSVVAGLLILLASLSLIEYLAHVRLGIDTMLARDAGSPQPGRMSPQTGLSLLLLGTLSLFLRVRKRLLGYAVDAVALGLCLMEVIILSGYLFGALELYGFSMQNRTSPQTLVSLTLLMFVAFGRRAEYGIFAILLGTGIGSRISRIASPIAFAVPFLLSMGRVSLVRWGLVGSEYATAVTTSLCSILAFCLVSILAWRINGLEREVQNLSLRDDLTGLYNRRGFYVLGEQMLRMTQRSDEPFSVLFVDLDNLKELNDSKGHETGSECLRQLAVLLTENFRESDLKGRVGGDEFVVAASVDEGQLRIAAERLQTITAHRNETGTAGYTIRFSYGTATWSRNSGDSLDTLLARADGEMYEAKRKKKAAR